MALRVHHHRVRGYFRIHALIGSGTTPKLIEHETEIKMIGYGTMLTEALISVVALLSAVTLDPSDYFAINTSAAVYAKLKMSVVDCRLSISWSAWMSPIGRAAPSPWPWAWPMFSPTSVKASAPMKYWFQFIIMFEGACFVLAQREGEVLRQMACGLTNEQIAEALHISYETVKEHVQHILGKIGVTDRTQAAVWAVRKNLA